ncbi:MAG TPA: PP2C family protein-serine/threonine phosphatase [Acidimicrobiia bacterium]
MTTAQVAELGPETAVDPRIEIRMATVGRLVRWIAAATALVVLLSVLIEPLKSFLPEGPVFVRSISPASAVTLAIMAVGALLAGDTRKAVATSLAWRRLGLALCGLAGLFGLGIMLLYMTGQDPAWDTRLGSVPAFTVGLVNVALSLAVLLMVSRREGRIIAGQVSALLVFSMTGVIFLGYAFGDPSLGRVFQTPEISFQAALTAFLTAIGVVLIRPASGLLATASSPGIGGRTLRRFGPVVLFAPAILLLITETLPSTERIDATALLAVTFGLLLLILLGTLVRVIDIATLEASAAGARAERAKKGLDQEAPIASRISDALHLVDVSETDGWEVVTRFRPGSGVVAGDTSAVRTLPDGTIGVVMVDVTGHGAEPALRAIRIRDLLLHSLAHGHDPADSLGFLGWASNDDLLASSVVMRIDPATGIVSFSSAGHPPVIHIGPQAVELVAPTGPLLYLDPDSKYQVASIEMTPGDTLIMFSDGVADVQRTRDGLPEPQALADMLLAEGGVPQRSADLTIGFGEADPSDDQSVVVVFRRH